MSTTSFRIRQRAYQAGLRSKIDDPNPFTDYRMLHWERGHRDRWLHGIMPERFIERDDNLAYVAIVLGMAAIAASLLSALYGA